MRWSLTIRITLRNMDMNEITEDRSYKLIDREYRNLDSFFAICRVLNDWGFKLVRDKNKA